MMQNEEHECAQDLKRARVASLDRMAHLYIGPMSVLYISTTVWCKIILLTNGVDNQNMIKMKPKEK